MLKHPDIALSCNLSPILDCGSVLGNRLAALFGFPNALLGIVMFTVLSTFGLLLLSGVELRKSSWKILAAVTLMLILFSIWFFGVSLYSIGKICIFCIFIWSVSVPIFLYGFEWLIVNKYLDASWVQSKFIKRLRNNHNEIVLGTYVLMLVLYFYRFREYYFL
jgi:uncharacterized membrane protein